MPLIWLPTWIGRLTVHPLLWTNWGYVLPLLSVHVGAAAAGWAATAPRAATAATAAMVLRMVWSFPWGPRLCGRAGLRETTLGWGATTPRSPAHGVPMLAG